MEPKIEVRVCMDGETATHTFDQLPIRFGRDPENDLVLPYPFVSRYHGRIDAHGDDLTVVDEGSRNGIIYRGSRLTMNAPASLGSVGDDFAIQRLTVSVVRAIRRRTTPPIVDEARSDMTFFVDAALGDRTSARISTTPPIAEAVEDRTDLDFQHDIGESELLGDDANESRTSLYADQHIQPRPLDDGLRALDDYRAARASALAQLRRTIEGVATGDRTSLVRELALAFTDLAHDPDLCELVATYGIDVSTPAVDAEAVLPMTEGADAALRGLLLLAARYAPASGALEGRREVSSFLARIDSVLAATFEFLDETAFAGEPSRHALEWNPRPGSGPGELPTRMFDRARDRRDALVGDARMTALQIMKELAPCAVEQDATTPWWLGPLRTRALWRAYVARHKRIASANLLTLWTAHCSGRSGPPSTPRFALPIPTRSTPSTALEIAPDDERPFDELAVGERIHAHV